METGSHELVILSYATVCLHPSVSLNNEQNCREISKDKIAVCEKTAGLRSGNSSDLNSACLKALVPVEIFQFSDMHYESRFLDTFRRHNIRPNTETEQMNFRKTSFKEILSDFKLINGWLNFKLCAKRKSLHSDENAYVFFVKKETLKFVIEL